MLAPARSRWSRCEDSKRLGLSLCRDPARDKSLLARLLHRAGSVVHRRAPWLHLWATGHLGSPLDRETMKVLHRSENPITDAPLTTAYRWGRRKKSAPLRSLLNF